MKTTFILLFLIFNYTQFAKAEDRNTKPIILGPETNKYYERHTWIKQEDLQEVLNKAISGDVKAQKSLAQHYKMESDYWLQEASKGGDQYAKYELAKSKALTDNDLSKNDAFELLKELAKEGEPLSAYTLGQWYEGGICSAYSVNQNSFTFHTDKDEGLFWIKVSAEKGYLAAILTLANFYASGDSIEKDCNKAIKLLNQAAEQRSYVAASQLESIFLGKGYYCSHVNSDLAKEWGKKAQEYLSDKDFHK